MRSLSRAVATAVFALMASGSAIPGVRAMVLPQGPQNAAPVPLTPETMTWRPAGQGLEMAMVDGTPGAEGQPFTMLMRLQDGAWIPPHTHNIAKRLVVMTGELRLGYGRVRDDATAVSLKPGSFHVVPAEQAHFEGSRGVTVVAMYGVGPMRTVPVGGRGSFPQK